MPTRAKQILAFGAVLAAGFASSAYAEAEPRTRLVDCEAGSCLLVTGSRPHAGSTVRINGHAVAVEGARRWRVSVPVETLRQWSTPYARTITVSVSDATTRTQASVEADLPIGLLGHAEDLAMLVVRVK
jgi:hypothetical protein